MSHQYDHETDLLLAATGLISARLHSDRHPGDPHGSASIDLATDRLVEAANDYITAIRNADD